MHIVNLWRSIMQKFSVPKMTCGHCKKTIEDALLQLDSGARIEVDLEAHVIEVATEASSDQVLNTLEKAGYEASLL